MVRNSQLLITGAPGVATCGAADAAGSEAAGPRGGADICLTVYRLPCSVWQWGCPAAWMNSADHLQCAGSICCGNGAPGERAAGAASRQAGAGPVRCARTPKHHTNRRPGGLTGDASTCFEAAAHVCFQGAAVKTHTFGCMLASSGGLQSR